MGLALHFPSPIEEAFEAERGAERIAHFRRTILGALFLFNSFLILDYFCLRPHFDICLVTRLGVASPLALLSYAAVSRVGRQMRETIFAFTPLPAMGCILLLYNSPPGYAAASQMSLIIMMMYMVNAMRPDFIYACCSIFAVAAGDSVFLALNPVIDEALAAAYASLIWTAALLALLASYWIESQERSNYLLRMRVQTQNAHLMLISTMDALTGIPNRRYLDNQLRTMWQEGIRRQEPIAALMIDLDRFKEINDAHGHGYGDTVLRVVASTLHDTLRDEQDIMARYGGEEFVAIFPNRQLESALVIAERLRIAVCSATLPPAGAVLHPRITISIGVASQTPQPGSCPDSLLREADTAMYEAKRRGRNRVCPVKEEVN
jgi:diguanylate cyclase (GGDEF)-like protein